MGPSVPVYTPSNLCYSLLKAEGGVYNICRDKVPVRHWGKTLGLLSSHKGTAVLFIATAASSVWVFRPDISGGNMERYYSKQQWSHSWSCFMDSFLLLLPLLLPLLLSLSPPLLQALDVQHIIRCNHNQEKLPKQKPDLSLVNMQFSHLSAPGLLWLQGSNCTQCSSVCCLLSMPQSLSLQIISKRPDWERLWPLFPIY